MNFTKFEMSTLLAKAYTSSRTLDAAIEVVRKEHGLSLGDAIRFLFHQYVSRVCQLPMPSIDDEDLAQSKRYYG